MRKSGPGIQLVLAGVARAAAEVEPVLVRAAAAAVVPAALEVEPAIVPVALEVLSRRLVVLRSERLWVVRQDILGVHRF